MSVNKCSEKFWNSDPVALNTWKWLNESEIDLINYFCPSLNAVYNVFLILMYQVWVGKRWGEEP